LTITLLQLRLTEGEAGDEMTTKGMTIVVTYSSFSIIVDIISRINIMKIIFMKEEEEEEVIRMVADQNITQCQQTNPMWNATDVIGMVIFSQIVKLI
jgi:hypothetical protein